MSVDPADTHLHRRAAIIVSEPWELAGQGAIRATVSAESAGRLLLSFDESLTHRGILYGAIVAILREPATGNARFEASFYGIAGTLTGAREPGSLEKFVREWRGGLAIRGSLVLRE